MRYKIEVLKGRSGAWYWRIVSTNGKISAHSEIYYSKSNAVRGARRLSKASGFPIRIRHI